MQINKACSRPSIQHQPIWDSELQRDIVTFHAGATFLALSRILCFTTMQQKHSLRKVCICIFNNILQKCLLPCIFTTYLFARKRIEGHLIL